MKRCMSAFTSGIQIFASRKLLVVTGREDVYFPIDGVEAAFDEIKEIYKKAGCEENYRLVVGEGEHRFYPDEAWPVFNEMSGWKEG